jgi:RNA polymerase sigma-70 factor (ECF subfamily)
MVDAFPATLAAAQTGDEAAIACLWRELQPALLRYLRGREPYAAEDVASETWLRAAKHLRSFTGNEVEFRAWMFTLARHALIDWQRRGMRRPVSGAVFDGENEQAAYDDPAAEAFEALDTERVLALIRRLPKTQADVILLRVISGLETERVAEIVGKQPATVRVIQHRALRNLAEMLGSEVFSEQGVTR